MILIGAVALAFIVLGVVVVFNGVLYTETLSSANTGQSASNAEATELEVRQGIACLAAEYEGQNLTDEDGNLSDGYLDVVNENENQLIEDIEEFDELYRNATAHSQPTAVDIDIDESNLLVNDGGVTAIEDTVTVRLSYDSSDTDYTRTLEIAPEECPS